MDTRYQVFVSSTYTDLVEERRAVMQCLLTMDCIPAGMELFPAADESVWGLIESVIKESDYYVLIIGGRYGSASRDNPMSYTQREYRLAIKLKVPVLAFLHGDPGKIPQEKTDLRDDARDALNSFRKEVGNAHHVNFWTSPHDLAAKAMLAIRHATKTHPRVGWIRADQRADPRTLRDLERLRRENEELRSKLAAAVSDPPAAVKDLAWNDEVVPGEYVKRTFEYRMEEERPVRVEPPLSEEFVALGLTWVDIFQSIGPYARMGCSEYYIHEAIKRRLRRDLSKAGMPKEGEWLVIEIPPETVHLIETQFDALGLWRYMDATGKGKGHQWWLTRCGQEELIRLHAIKRGGKRVATRRVEPTTPDGSL